MCECPCVCVCLSVCVFVCLCACVCVSGRHAAARPVFRELTCARIATHPPSTAAQIAQSDHTINQRFGVGFTLPYVSLSFEATAPVARFVPYCP